MQTSPVGASPRAQRVHHVSILVTDLAKAEEFYGGVLGLRRLQRPGGPTRGLFFEVGDAQLHITLTDKAEPESLRHTAFEVDDLDAALREVANMGLPIWDDTPLPGWVRKQCRDPSGNGVELLQRVNGEMR
jgi:catechol 2,3-dioxygenase-like lactoylglutathione lyase family enzyme